MSTQGGGDLSSYNSRQIWVNFMWIHFPGICPKTLIFLSSNGLDDNDDGGSDDPRIDSDTNRESWHLGHVRCDLVMWGVRGRDPFVHKFVTARLGWSRSNIMFVVLNQILHHCELVLRPKNKPQRWNVLGMQLESAFFGHNVFLVDCPIWSIWTVCAFVYLYLRNSNYVFLVDCPIWAICAMCIWSCCW